jgi:predicted P-loop ATPase
VIIDDFTSPLEAAEQYFALGLLPVRLHGLLPDLRCGCGNPDCLPRNAGKHPVSAGWTKNIPRTLDDVREQFKGHRGNVGILLDNRYVLIDADGQQGLEDIDTLGEMPDTLTQVSGSQSGGHWIYRLQPHQDAGKITDRRLPGMSIDVKVRGQFVAAPSLHASGHRYRWAEGHLMEPAPLPDHLYARLCKPTEPTRPQVSESGPSLERVRRYVAKMDPAIAGQGGHNAAYRAACFIVGQGLSEDDELAVFYEYNDRCEPPWSNAELLHKLRDARRNSTTQPLPDEGWKNALRFKDRKGVPVIAQTVSNAVIVLRHDPRWRGRIRKDNFILNISVTDPPWADVYAPITRAQHWRDSDTSRLQAWLQDNYDLDLTVTDLDAAVVLVAEANEHNSARDWFESITWDGVNRVDTWLTRYIGSGSGPYVSAVGRWWLISAVARVYKPGCKADHMLILYGDQGVGKSSAAGLLAGPEWFSDSPVPIGSKDAYLALQGKLIVEMAELDSVNRAEASAVKGFISAQTDCFRPPYGRRNVDVPRQCVFIGSTNHIEMLRDETGDRRFWPVTCGNEIDRAGIQRDREQIWAEAVALYKAGERWHPFTAEERRLCKEAQTTHQSRHPWTDKILDWAAWGEVAEATLVDVMEKALGMEAKSWGVGDVQTAKACLRQAGWRFDPAVKKYRVDSL